MAPDGESNRHSSDNTTCLDAETGERVNAMNRKMGVRERKWEMDSLLGTLKIGRQVKKEERTPAPFQSCIHASPLTPASPDAACSPGRVDRRAHLHAWYSPIHAWYSPRLLPQPGSLCGCRRARVLRQYYNHTTDTRPFDAR